MTYQNYNSGYDSKNPYGNTSYKQGDRNPFGGTGGGGGGGFLAGGQGGEGPSSQDGAPGGGRRTNESLRPVTIRQLLTAEHEHQDADHKIDNEEVGNVTVVANVRSYTAHTTHTSYVIEDGTGTIDVRMWIDSNAASDEGGGSTANKGKWVVEENKYIRVIGKLKTFSNKTHLAAQHVRPIEDMNEINFHLLEAQYVHLVKTKGVPNKGLKAEEMTYGGHSDYARSNNKSAGNRDQFAEISNPLYRKILQIVSTSTEGEDGMHIETIRRSVGKSLNEVKDAVENLTGEGLLFSTIDEEHFAYTSAD